MERRAALLLAVASGLLLAAAFPPVGLFPLVFVALVPLFYAIERSDPRRGRRGAGTARSRRLFVTGWIAGFVFFLALLYWIPFLPPNNLTIPWLMGPSLVIMAAYLALFPGLFALALGWCRAGGRVSLLIAAPVLWASLEYLRSNGTLGFPWGSAGYALAPIVTTLQFASITGIWGVTAWVVLINVLFYLVLQRMQGKRRALILSLIILAFAIPVIHSRNIVTRPIPGKPLHVALIQANLDSETKWNPAYREAIIGKLFRMTRNAARDTTLDLIVWPEAAPPFLLARDFEYLPRVRDLVDSLRVPLLSGSVDSRRESDGLIHHYNSAILVQPGGGALDIYDKVRLVPFSERMPFQKTMPFLSAFDWGQSDFSEGERHSPLQANGRRFGPLICFEAIFPPLARTFVNEGAAYLINITNDQWFGNTAAPSQHAEMALFRAVENRRAIGRCANTGISMFIDPYGRVLSRTRTFVDATLIGDLALPQEETFYSRHGDVAAWIFVAVSVLLLALPLVLKPL